MNLYASYNNLLSNHEINSNKNFETYFADDATIQEFILNKYLIREKGRAFEVATKRFNLFKRGKHEVSTYLLGCLLKDIIWDDLKNFIRKFTDEKDTDYIFDFEYIWSLLAVYHDIAVEKEQKLRLDYGDKSLYSTKEIVECIIKHGFSIDRNIYQDNCSVVPLYHTYQDELVINYMNMRMKSNKENQGSFDHGIVAGFLLYDALVDNYFVQKTKAGCKGEEKCFLTRSRNNDKMLTWHELDLWMYGFIADAIIAHNIWFCELDKKGEKAKYENYQLGYLIVDSQKDNRLSAKNNPLAFYLGLVDSIEPIKRFPKNNAIYVCKNISVTLKNKEIIIENIDLDDNYNDYKENIKRMEMWLKVKVVEVGNKITVRIL